MTKLIELEARKDEAKYVRSPEDAQARVNDLNMQILKTLSETFIKSQGAEG